MEFSFPYKTKTETIELGDSTFTIECLNSLDETIDDHFLEYERTGKEELFAELCPYFGVPWPAGQLLAKYVQGRAVDWKNSSILELGCGLALPSMVLASRGLKVKVMDVHPDVPVFLERNLAANNISGLHYVHGDWTIEAGAPEEVLIGSDILYDAKTPAVLVKYLAASPNWKEAIIADPGRPHLGAFFAAVGKMGWTRTEVAAAGGSKVHRIQRV